MPCCVGELRPLVPNVAASCDVGQQLGDEALSGWEVNLRSISSGRKGVTSLCWLKTGERGIRTLTVPFPMGGLAAPSTCMVETTLPMCACCPVEILADGGLAGTCSASASCVAWTTWAESASCMPRWGGREFRNSKGIMGAAMGEMV